ncbi:hypothetical protein CPB86DRAFT_791963 [Serendipita vermifera]|nr:hypothetical protein CPB86DRAFT_791963 [Serendipita vermifera]
MPLSLLERVPVEIWEKIFYHATRSPLLPFAEDGRLTPDLVDNLLLFSVDCEVYDAYRARTQTMVERLRLVCRAWANLLQPKTNELSLTDWNGYFYPSIQSAFTTKLWYCFGWYCACERKGCTYRTQTDDEDPLTDCNWEKLDQQQDSRAFHERFPRLRILGWEGMNSSAKTLGMITGLQALSIIKPGGIFDAPAAELSHHLARLTHLELCPFPIHSRLAHERFIHPRLQYLSISLYYDPAGLLKGEAMGQWSLPSLRTLYIDGKVDDQVEKETIHRFVMRHVEGLAGLGLVYHRGRDKQRSTARAPSGIWDCVYPNLEVLGIDVRYIDEGDTGWVRRDTRPDCQVRRVVVSMLEYSPLDGTSRISRLIKEVGRMWGVKVFVCAKSWETVKNGLYEESRSVDRTHRTTKEIAQSLRHVIEMLEVEGMVMVDPFEVTLQEAYDYLVDRSERVPAPMYR